MCALVSQFKDNITEKIPRLGLLIRTILHAVYCFINISVTIYGISSYFSKDISEMKDPEVKNMMKYILFYFTNWNYSFQTIFLVISLLYDILEWRRKHKNKTCIKIRYWRDVFYCGVVLPGTVFVTSMFWVLYAIDRELVFRKVLDTVIPWWMNQCVHTNVFVLIILEMIVQPRRKPTNFMLENILYWVMAIGYGVAYYTIYFVNHHFIYPVFDVLNWWQICLLQLVSWLVSYAAYLLQFPVNRLIHGSQAEIEISIALRSSDEEINNVNTDNGMKEIKVVKDI